MIVGINLRYIVNTYVNITIDPPAQLLYADKIIIKKDKGKRVPVVIPVCRWG
jgi:hypothetical protein